MTAVYDGFAAPARILWTGASTTASSMSLSTWTLADVGPGGTSARVCWTSPYYTFQVQWRARRRLSPSSASAASENGSPTAAEAWTDWGAWEGNDLSAEVKTPTERLSWGDLSVTSALFPFPYDFSQYDKIVYQVRVRVFDEPSNTCSEWGYADLPVEYIPAFASASATRRPDGGATLSVATNWGRGGSLLRVTALRRGSADAEPSGWTASLSGAEPSVEIVVPAGAVQDADALYLDMSFTTSDGRTAKASRMRVDVSEEGASPSAEPPSVAVSDEGPRARVSVEPPEGASYSAVHVSAAWPAAPGGGAYEDAEASEAGDGTWEAWVDAPPYDVEGTYRVWAVYDDGFAYAEAAHVTPSKGRCTWSDGAEAVSLMLDLSFSSSAKPSVEVVETVGGGSAARFGTGRTRTLAAGGKLVAPLPEGGWREVLDALREPHAWTFRKPGGERCRVAVESVSDSEEAGAVDRVVAVSVSMREVS